MTTNNKGVEVLSQNYPVRVPLSIDTVNTLKECGVSPITIKFVENLLFKKGIWFKVVQCINWLKGRK